MCYYLCSHPADRTSLLGHLPSTMAPRPPSRSRGLVCVAQAQRVVQKSREHILALLNPDVLRPSLWKSVVLQKPLTLYKVCDPMHASGHARASNACAHACTANCHA